MHYKITSQFPNSLVQVRTRKSKGNFFVIIKGDKWIAFGLSKDGTASHCNDHDVNK